MPNKEFQDLTMSSFRGKYVVFFWYPLDFTFVCPTEIIAFGDRSGEFEAINCQVIAASCDSQFTHLAWVNTPRSAGGLGDMKIPIVADFDKSVAQKYGVMCSDKGGDKGVPLRALFIISPTGVLRHITCNDLPVGRNVDEILRLVQGFQYVDVHGEVCPANWTPGAPTMIADPVKANDYWKSTWSESAASGVVSGEGSVASVADSASFAKAVKSGVSIVDFWAPWCKNCPKLNPVLAKLASSNSGVNFIKVNTVDSQDVAMECDVSSLPTLQFYFNGAKFGEFVGSDPAKAEAAIANAIASKK